MTIQRVGLIWLLSVFGGIFPDTPQEVTLMTTERTGLMLEFICVCWHLLGYPGRSFDDDKGVGLMLADDCVRGIFRDFPGDEDPLRERCCDFSAIYSTARAGLCSAVLGCARLCSAVFGWARLCSAVFGWARLCSAVFGWARLCSAVFGWARLGSGWMRAGALTSCYLGQIELEVSRHYRYKRVIRLLCVSRLQLRVLDSRRRTDDTKPCSTLIRSRAERGSHPSWDGQV